MELSKSEIRQFKARAQLLEPVVQIGKQGLSASVVASTNQALADHELIKVRFNGIKDRQQKRAMAADLGIATHAALVTSVGHVSVFYRPDQEQKTQPLYNLRLVNLPPR